MINSASVLIEDRNLRVFFRSVVVPFLYCTFLIVEIKVLFYVGKKAHDKLMQKLATLIRPLFL